MTDTERVARAICVELGQDPDTQVMLWDDEADNYASQGLLWMQYERHANAAICTLKEGDEQ